MSSRKFCIVPGLAVVAMLVGWCACPALGQQTTYDIRHSFTVTPGGNMRPWVGGLYNDFVFVNQTGFTNSSSAMGWVRIPAAGFNRSYQAKVWPMPSEGEANSTIQVNAYGVGTPVVGNTRSNGFAKIVGTPPVSASASSTTMVIVIGRQRLRSGLIAWLPAFIDVNTGMAAVGNSGRRNDPVMLRVKDMETGVVVTEIPVNITWSILGNGSVSWEEGVLSVDGLDAQSITFVAEVGSAHVEEAGTLMLEIVGGTITYSYDDGIFEGVLPLLGSPGQFAAPIISPIVLTYDFGDFGGHPLETFIHLGGGGLDWLGPQYLDNLRDVRELPDDTEVHITAPKAVAAQSGEFTDGRIYVEEPMRTSGICVHPGAFGPFLEGDRIEFWGYVRTDPFSGERYVDMWGLDSKVSDPTDLVQPLGMTNKTAAADETTGGVDVSGMLVKVWGKITYREPNGRYIYIDDGSGLLDGTLDSDGEIAVPLVGLRVVLDEQTTPIVVPPEADYAVVTGERGMADGVVPCVLPDSTDVPSFFDIWPGGDG